MASYRKAREIRPLHTSGPIVVTRDAKRIVTCLGEEALLTNVESGQLVCRFFNDTTNVTAMALSPSETDLVVITASLSIRIYPMPSLYDDVSIKPIQPSRHIPKAHDAPVHVAVIDATSSFLATGSADGVVKVWDLRRGYATHAFKGHGGVISCLCFYVYPGSQGAPRVILATGSVDTRIRLFDLAQSNIRSGITKPIMILDGHVSVPRGLAFSKDGNTLLTAGRDSVVLVWKMDELVNLGGKKGKKMATPALVKTIPVSEAVESLGVVEPTAPLLEMASSNSLLFYIAGEKGYVHIWDALQAKRLVSLGLPQGSFSKDSQEIQSIQEAQYCQSASTIVSLHADQNITFHSLQSLKISRHLIGFNDEIVDAALLSSNTLQDTHLALATNSSLLRIYPTSSEHGINCSLLAGHLDTILALDSSVDGRLLASVSKDTFLRIWAPIEGIDDRWGCIGIGEGHAESVGAVSMFKSSTTSSRFIVTGSQDRTIKLWDLSDVDLVVKGEQPRKLSSLVTQKAHDKDVNSIDISPNDKLLATGSQDKTAKIFEINLAKSRASLKHVGTLRGHKRGIWNVKFSSFEKVIATASGDKSVKLWTLEDFSCVKTFEGHTNSVLRVNFVNQGQQLLTTASDGLLKLWNIPKETCVTTMDNHEDKVWALAVTRDEKTVITAAADSVVTFWEDSTEIEKEQAAAEKEKAHEIMMQLNQHIISRDYKSAIFLSISTNQPRRLYELFKTVYASRDVATYTDDVTGELREVPVATNVTGSTDVDEVIRTLPLVELAKLLRHIRDWNATARTSAMAQVVLHAIVKLRPASDIQAAFGPNLAKADDEAHGQGNEQLSKRAAEAESLRDVIDALIPYTERHLARTDRLVQDSYVLDFLLREMDPVGLEDEGMEIDVY